MREYDPAVVALLAERRGVTVRHLVWIKGRNRGTGVVEEMGVWNGNDARNFSIKGSTRPYHGAGALLEVEPITAELGLQVRAVNLTLSGATPEVLLAVYGYEPRLAPIEIHRAIFDPETNFLVAEPHRIFFGAIDKIDPPQATYGGPAAITVTALSAARMLTRPLTVKKSDETQRRIDADDRGREYSAISGAVPVVWGQNTVRGAPPATIIDPVTLEDLENLERPVR